MDFEKLESTVKKVIKESYDKLSLEVFEIVNETKLRWTEEVPDTPGWYWAKWPGGGAEIVHIVEYPGTNLTVFYMDSEISSKLSEIDKRIMWAGPIPQPQDAE